MQSRVEDILQAMIDGTESSELPKPQSRNEDLLLQVLDKMNEGGGGAVIDDTTVSTTKTWSSSKIDSTKLDANQGGANSGKVMGVDATGDVVPVEVEGGNIAVTETPVSGDDYAIDIVEGEHGSVTSVAGKTGVVTLNGDDVSYSDLVDYGNGTVGGEIADLKSQAYPCLVYSKKPNVSTSNSTLTIYNGTTIAIGNKRYYPASSADVIIDLSTASSAYKKILFDRSSSTFRCVNWDVIASITSSEIIFCTIVINSTVCLLSANFSYTVDGLIPFLSDIVVDALGTSTTKAISQRIASEYINSTGNITLVPSYNLLPNIDSINRTIDFGGSAVLYIGKKRFSLGSGFRSVALVASGSTANYHKLVFDVSNSEFSALEYAASITSNQVVIGTVNLNSSYKYIESAEMPFSYTIDKNLPNRACSPTGSLRLNRFIRGLYLRGIDSAMTYFVSTVRYNTSANLFYLVISSQDTSNNVLEAVAYKGTVKPSTTNEILRLSPSNDSGITGYAYVNWAVFETNTYVETAATAGITTINPCCFEIESFPALYNYYQTVETDVDALELVLRNTVRQAKAVDGQQTFGLLWFSDLHGSYLNLKRIMEFKAKHASLISDVIHTGDIIRNLTSDDFEFWGSAGAGNVLNVIGNHDVWISQGNYADAAYAYNRYFAPYISTWGVTYTPDKCYYYKDYDAYNIRLIVLDNMHWDAEQQSWLVSTLAGASGKHVLIAMHYQPFVATDTPNLTGWNSMFTSSETANGDIDTAVQSFVSGGGKFIAYICGHTHFNKLGRLNGRNELSIVTSTASYTAGQDSYRRFYGKTCDLFNLLSVDTNAGVVKVLRCGSDINSALQHSRFLCYDYINGEYIAID